ncbi:hypothetical protein BFW01_g12833 [Lasiodiplodia theobromae]|nr:hypothetical protein BFW01_g12833 [Lasiodiplodia theobromae]
MQGLFALLLFSQVCFGLLEERFVAFEQSDGAIPLHIDTAIVYPTDDPVGIRIAAESLAEDLRQITGSPPTLLRGDAQHLSNITFTSVILVGTLTSDLIKRLQSEKGLEVSEIEGKWESFKTTVIADPLPGVRNGLVIAGSDKRGAMFGVYTLSEQCGQSPFHWWADVPATEHSELYALPKTTVHGEPSVKYRGLFINDEAPALTGWWSRQHNDTFPHHHPLDASFYRHVFDLLLRLKANYLWPAMWASFVPRPGNIFFTDDPANQQLADDYGIVVSTSHHEPMQRATNEWNETETGPWDWTANKENVTRFMEEGVARAGRNESYFTLGMRGPNDGPIEADDPIEVLEDVFETERRLLGKYYGNETAARQVWTIYKEVATYYAAGLVPPDDVTLMFTDDNWGNVQRLPVGNETERSGGIGIYFHLEYVGTPKSYKWANSNNLAKVYKDLFHSYARGADRIWVINVADIKPMELPFGFIMDLAWNTSSIDFATIPAYLHAFSTREFGPTHASEIASILLEHSRLVGRRKLESVIPSTYSVLNYHESSRVLAEWADLAARTSAIAAALPETLQAPFFHLVRHPVQAGYLHHAIVLGQALNAQHALERRNTANRLASSVLASFDQDYDLQDEYDSLSNGKWAGIMAQPRFDFTPQATWKAPSRDVLANLSFVQLRQDMDYAFGNLGIYAEGSASAGRQGVVCASIDESAPTSEDEKLAPVLPVMDPYGAAVRTVELFHRGDYRKSIAWAVEPEYDWVKVEPRSGVVDGDGPEQRLNVSVDWNAVPEGFDGVVDVRVDFDTSPWMDLIRVPVVNRPALPDDFRGFPETGEGVVAIEAPHFQRSSSSSSSSSSEAADDDVVAFRPIPHLGTRTASGSLALRPYLAARASPAAAQDAWVDYAIYLFNATSNITATLYINAALDTDPDDLPMRYSLTLDDAPANWTRVLEAPATAGDLPPGWTGEVRDGVWKRIVRFEGPVGAGKHWLRWRVNSPEVYLEKVVVETREGVAGVREAYLGVPETGWV